MSISRSIKVLATAGFIALPFWSNVVAGELPVEHAFSSLTDSSSYNSASFAGSPLGWLETEKNNLTADLGMEVSKLKSNDIVDQNLAIRRFNTPHIRAGVPGTIFFDLFYGPEKINYDNISVPTYGVPIQRFGFNLAGGALSQKIMAGFSGNGFIGKQTQDGSSDKRVKMGFSNVKVHLGSQISEIIRIGAFYGLDGYLDTLQNSSGFYQERFFDGTFPSWGGFIDLSKEGFPVRSDLLFSMATPRFVYVLKGIPNQKLDGNEDAIEGDSLIWAWKTMCDIKLPFGSINPAVKLGYKRNKEQVCAPTEKNNPWSFGPDESDSNWTVSSFEFGIGSAFNCLNILQFEVDYAIRNLKIKSGPAYENYSVDKPYHSTVVKLTGNINNIEALNFPKSIGLSLKAGFVNFYYNRFIDPWFYGDQYYLSESIFANRQYSQTYRYDPHYLTAQDRRVTGFLTGFESSFFNKALNLDFDLLIDGQKGFWKMKGTELGLTLSYMIKSKGTPNKD